MSKGKRTTWTVSVCLSERRKGLKSDRSRPRAWQVSQKNQKSLSGTPSNETKRPKLCVEPGGEAPKRPEKPKETLAENGRETPFPPLPAAGSTINKGGLATAHEPARRLTEPKRRLTNPRRRLTNPRAASRNAPHRLTNPRPRRCTNARAASRTRAPKPAGRRSTPGRIRRRLTNPLEGVSRAPPHEPVGRRKTPDAAARTRAPPHEPVAPPHEPARRLTNPRRRPTNPRAASRTRAPPHEPVKPGGLPTAGPSRTPSNEIRAAVVTSRKGLTDSLNGPRRSPKNDMKSSQGLPPNGKGTVIAGSGKVSLTP